VVPKIRGVNEMVVRGVSPRDLAALDKVLAAIRANAAGFVASGKAKNRGSRRKRT
jgi:hypothetical protein